MSNDYADGRSQRWFSIDEAAMYIGVSRRTLERAVQDGTVASVRNPLTRRRQFDRRMLDALMRRTDGRGVR